jgi:hypothetical protein
MPVILEAKDFEPWGAAMQRAPRALMKPAGENVLQKWPGVKTRELRAPDDDPTLIERLDEVSAPACGFRRAKSLKARHAKIVATVRAPSKQAEK